MIKELEGFPEYANTFFQNVKNSYDDEYLGTQVAWEATKSKLRSENGFVVANSKDFCGEESFLFVLEQPDVEIVANEDGDEVVMDAVLATTDKNDKGQYFTESDLRVIADQINTEGSVLPTTSHDDLYDAVRTYGGSPDLVANALRKKRGVFNTIKASVQNGKLWVQARLDKAYKGLMNAMKALSIEVLGKKDESGRIRNPRYMSFIFTNNPRLKDAKIVKS